MPVKTLHLTNSWHESSGGIAAFYRALFATADDRGHVMRLVVPGPRDRIEDVGRFGKIFHVQAPRAPFNGDYRILYPSQYLAVGSKVQQILIAERPDLVEICDKYALNYLGALLRRALLPGVAFRPVVVGLTCERMDDNFHSYVGRVPFADAICGAYVKWLYFAFFDHHIANSAYTAEELRRASRGHITARNAWILPMGVDLENFSPERRSAEARARVARVCGASESSTLLLYAGRLAPEKNLALLFDCFLRLVQSGERDYRLIIAGEGIERAKWESFCSARIPDRATFLGFVRPSEELANLMANTDAFVHPNPREPFGIAPLQAMASGLPLLAPNRGGVTTYANVENAWLAAPDAGEFARTLRKMFDDEGVRRERTQRALETAKRFEWPAVAARFLDLYAELCAASASTAAVARPDFSSQQAQGFELAASRKVSAAVEQAFRWTSGIFERLRSADGRVTWL